MTTFTSGAHRNCDPLPWTEPSGDRAARKPASGAGWHRHPRHEFDLGALATTSSILVAFRQVLLDVPEEWAVRAFLGAFTLEASVPQQVLEAVHLNSSDDERDHAKRILTRLASCSGIRTDRLRIGQPPRREAMRLIASEHPHDITPILLSTDSGSLNVNLSLRFPDEPLGLKALLGIEMTEELIDDLQARLDRLRWHRAGCPQ